MTPVDADSGTHICLRAPDAAAVHAFHAAAIKAGGTSDGAPGPRPEYTEGYYAAFVRDPEGNKIEAVTFTQPSGERSHPPGDLGAMVFWLSAICAAASISIGSMSSTRSATR